MWIDFQNSFTDWFRPTRNVSMYTWQRFPHHLQYTVTLPCESRKPKMLRNFSATRMRSADYVVERRLPVCLSVCPSLRPSVHHTHRRVATLSLFFSHQTVWKYSDGDHLNRDVKCNGYEKIAIFDEYLAISQKMTQHTAIVTMECK